MKKPPARPESPQLTSDQHAKLAIAYAMPRPEETAEDLRLRRRRSRYHAVMSRYAMRVEQQAFEAESLE